MSGNHTAAVRTYLQVRDRMPIDHILSVYGWAFRRDLVPIGYDAARELWLMSDGESYCTPDILSDSIGGWDMQEGFGKPTSGKYQRTIDLVMAKVQDPEVFGDYAPAEVAFGVVYNVRNITANWDHTTVKETNFDRLVGLVQMHMPETYAKVGTDNMRIIIEATLDAIADMIREEKNAD